MLRQKKREIDIKAHSDDVAKNLNFNRLKTNVENG